ncbi:T9SS type A sorting domain-containing protein [Puteibacter caeruleilacunae]|nr:T9SS type A sorting domain-containing protein [Puteibacter caeruleilacunae]
MRFRKNNRWIGLLAFLALVIAGNHANAQYRPVQDGQIEIEGRTWFTKDIGEIYTPTVYSYDELNAAWKIYGCGQDFGRSSSDDIGPLVLTEIPNGDWELIVKVLQPDNVGATGFAYKEIWLDDGTGTGTSKLYYPGEVLAPQNRHTSNQRYGIIFRESLEKRCRELSIGSGRLHCRFVARKEYIEDEDGKILTDSRFVYSGGSYPFFHPDYPAWLRIVKRGNDYNTYYALENEDISYDNADEVKWNFKEGFTMEMDSANIYAGIFFGANLNKPIRGSSYDVRDPRVTQMYSNLILREAPPLWRLANPLADQAVETDDWLEIDITDMFDHDEKDDLDYQVVSSDEHIGFAYIDKSLAEDGSKVRTLKVKGISDGVAKLNITWDVGGYHLEDELYVQVKAVVAENADVLMNHVNLGGDPSGSYIRSNDDENGRIRLLRNAGGNNHSAFAKRMSDAALYFPMSWDGTADSIEVLYDEVSDSRFFETFGLAIMDELTDNSTAAGVGEYTTVSGGKGYQTSYFYTREAGSSSMGIEYSPGHKKGDSKTDPNKVLFKTQLKLVRSSATTIDLYSKRPEDAEWDHRSVEIAEIGDYYFVIHQSQTRGGNGSFFTDLKINGEDIMLEDEVMTLDKGEERVISVAGCMGQKLGETWTDFAIKAEAGSGITAGLENGQFYVIAPDTDNYRESYVVVSAMKDGKAVKRVIKVVNEMEQSFEAYSVSEVDNDDAGSVTAGDATGEYTFNSFMSQLNATKNDYATYMYEELMAEDSVETTVFIESLENTGEKTKAGLLMRSTNLGDSVKYAGLFVTPEEGLKFQYRWKDKEMSVIEDIELEEDIELKAPLYLKLKQANDVFYPYVSKDGVEWYTGRKYAFPLKFEGDYYYAGFAASTTDNFKKKGNCHIQEFEILTNVEMNVGSTDLPVFKSIGVDLDDDKQAADLKDIAPESGVSIFWGADKMANIEINADEAGKFEAGVYNVKGQQVRIYTPSMLPAGLSQISINLTNLQRGVYIIKANSVAAGSAVQKIVVH